MFQYPHMVSEDSKSHVKVYEPSDSSVLRQILSRIRSKHQSAETKKEVVEASQILNHNTNRSNQHMRQLMLKSVFNFKCLHLNISLYASILPDNGITNTLSFKHHQSFNSLFFHYVLLSRLFL